MVLLTHFIVDFCVHDVRDECVNSWAYLREKIILDLVDERCLIPFVKSCLDAHLVLQHELEQLTITVITLHLSPITYLNRWNHRCLEVLFVSDVSVAAVEGINEFKLNFDL